MRPLLVKEKREECVTLPNIRKEGSLLDGTNTCSNQRK